MMPSAAFHYISSRYSSLNWANCSSVRPREVPPDIWYYLSKGDRGTLCHQGGRFISFTRDGELIAVDPVAERHQLWRIHGS